MRISDWSSDVCSSDLGEIDFAVAIAAGADLYFNPAVLHGPPANGKKATKSEVAASCHHWADIDPPKDVADLDAWRATALDRLHAAGPTFINDSGRGYWGFWERSTFSADIAEIEGVNLALGTPLGAEDRKSTRLNSSH